MRKRSAALQSVNIGLMNRVLLVALAAAIGILMPLSASAQTLRGTQFTTESGDHTVEWNDNWIASLTEEDDFSTMVMLEGQIMIYAVMFIHDPDLGLSEKAVYHSLSGVLVNNFDSPPTQSIEWESDDGSYRGAHLLNLSGIDFVLYLRVDPATEETGPTMQFAAAPVRAFPVSLEAMQTELTVDGNPVLDGDNGEEVMSMLDSETAESETPVAEESDSTAEESDSADEESQPAPASARPSGEQPPALRDSRDAGNEESVDSEPVFYSEANDYTVTYPESWIDMAETDATVGEFSLASETDRMVVSFTGRSTTETNRQAFFEDIAARESRYPGFVDSVITDDRLLIATWTADNELAVLEYVFINDTTVVTIMVTITSGNPARYIEEIQAIELNDEPILRDWDTLWPEDE